MVFRSAHVCFPSAQKDGEGGAGADLGFLKGEGEMLNDKMTRR